jgi:predicted DNA-binding transcriptional regulator YafY
MTNTATRLITLIMLLQRQTNQKAADLAARLGVSVRSLHRYIAMLDEMGIPVYSERGPYGGFSLVRGYKMPPLVFTPEEAVAVTLGTSLVGEMWGQLYQEAAQGALAKLDNVLPDEQRQEVGWARRSLVATGLLRAGLEGQASFLEKLRRGVRELRRVHLDYQSSNRPEVITRKLDPYGLVHRMGWWYVVGYCHLRQAVRLFRIDRIRELALTDETFTPPTSFDVRQYMETEFQEQPQVLARMRFAPEGAFIARDGYPAWDSWEEQADGSILVTFRSPDLNWAASTVLAYGPLVEVLEPLELRQTVQEWADAVASTYNQNNQSEGIQP